MTSTAITWLPSRPVAQDSSASLQPLFRARRRIVLVDLYWTRDKDPRVPLGHASLLAALRAEPMIEAISVVLPVNLKFSLRWIADRILSHTKEISPDEVDIGIGAYIWNEALLQALLPMLRTQFPGRIILGGPQISYVEGGLENLYPQADIFIRGAAESSLTLAVRSGKRLRIPGVHYAGSPDAGAQSATDFISLPSPILNGIIALKGQSFVRWETKRGCQFKCSFCQHRQPDAKIKPTIFPDDRIMEEIDRICEAGVTEVAVLDPVFNGEANGHSERVLARFAANGYGGRLELQCRAEMITEPFLDATKGLKVCLEFGLQTIHSSEQKAIDRPNNIAAVERVLKEVRRRGIDFEVSLIFGLPEQTLDSFLASVRWCLEQDVPVIKAFPLLLLRGTDLDLNRAKWDMLVEDETMPEVLSSNTFSQDDRAAMLAISQALKDTQGRHPKFHELISLAASAIPDQSRFQPEFSGEAA